MDAAEIRLRSKEALRGQAKIMAKDSLARIERKLRLGWPDGTRDEVWHAVLHALQELIDTELSHE